MPPLPRYLWVVTSSILHAQARHARKSSAVLSRAAMSHVYAPAVSTDDLVARLFVILRRSKRYRVMITRRRRTERHSHAISRLRHLDT